MLRKVLSLAFAVVTLGAAPLATGSGSAADDGVWVLSLVNQPQGEATVELFADGTGYVQRANQDGRYFWKTQDGGVTYVPVLELPPGRMLDFVSPNTGYAASSGSLWTTTDGASSWTPATLPQPLAGRDDAISSIYADDTGTVALGLVTEEPGSGSCPFNPFTEQVQIAVSRDGTATWERLDLMSSPGSVRALEFDGDFGVAIFSDTQWTQTGQCSFSGTGTGGDSVYAIERITETGAGGELVWTARKVFDCSPRRCGAIGLAEPGVFTIGYADGGISHTDDGGDTFAHSRLDHYLADQLSVTTGEPNLFWVTDIEFATPTIGYAVTQGRGMWRTDDGGATWFSEPSPRELEDIGIADLGVAGPDHALAGGPTMVVRRLVSQ